MNSAHGGPLTAPPRTPAFYSAISRLCFRFSLWPYQAAPHSKWHHRRAI